MIFESLGLDKLYAQMLKEITDEIPEPVSITFGEVWRIRDTWRSTYVHFFRKKRWILQTLER